MESIKNFSPEQYAGALESWAWAGLEGKAPVFASAFGDVFFRASDGFWFLDTVEGKLSKEWDDEGALRAALRAHEGQQKYLMTGLVHAATQAGITLTPPEIFDFKVAPVLGGALDVSNVTRNDFVVAVNIAGQVHEQVKNLPPGTRISGVSIR